jgi:hypothetical protein
MPLFCFFTTLPIKSGLQLISLGYDLKDVKHVLLRALRSNCSVSGQLLPLRVYKKATKCRIFDAKMTMQIPYGLGLYYTFVMFKKGGKRNFWQF